MAKIKISYETIDELESIKQLLKPIVKKCKISKNEKGTYKKAYIEVKKC